MKVMNETISGDVIKGCRGGVGGSCKWSRKKRKEYERIKWVSHL